jgi:DNA-dependent RNA polymerase auxiliary subunit epsilon
MLKHFSDTDIVNYLERKLPPADLLSADDHLAECDLCYGKIAARKSVRSGAANFQIAFLNHIEDDHLTYEQLALFVDGEANEIEREIVGVHRKICRDCAAQIDELRELRNLSEIEKSESAAPSGKVSTSGWWNQLWAYPSLKFAVPAFAMILVGVMIWAVWRSPERLPRSEIAQVVEPTPAANQAIAPPETNTANNSVNENVSAENVNQANPNLAQSKNLIALNDGNSRLELDENGKITGLNAPQYEAKIKSALTAQAVEISPDVKKLKSAGGVLMGDGDKGVPFALSNPIGKIIQTNRPQFRWRPLPDAESYTVSVYDENFNKIAASEPLQKNEWRINAPLKRGQIYQWQVTAILKNGEETKSPVRPAPDAKFKVLDAAKANEIEQAKKRFGNSRLLLGILYANAGLLDEAAGEFQMLLKKNPKSEAARKLLRQVQSKR